MNRVGWALALTCLLALGGLAGRVGSCAPAAYADQDPGPREPPRPPVVRVQTDTAGPKAPTASSGFDPANATVAAEPEPADATSDDTSDAPAKPGCNAIPFVLPLIGILGLVWLRMKKTMK